MMTLKRLFAVLLVSLMAGCGGGGGDSGTSPFKPAPDNSASAVSELLISMPDSISNSGNETVLATITAVDTGRNTVANVKITVTVDNDAVVSLPAGAVTGSDGKVQAQVGIGSNSANRTIVVTATAGGIAKSANLSVVTGKPTTPTAADIALKLSASSVPNSGSVTVTATVTTVDANRNTVSGIPVALKVDSDATISVSGDKSNASGIVTGVVGIGANRSNRVIKVTATSGTLTREVGLQVTGTRISATALPAVVSGSAAGKVQYKVTDASNAPMSDLEVAVIAAGAQSTGRTDSSGFYEFSYVAPAADGNLRINASSGGVGIETIVVVQSGAGTIPSVPLGSVRSASVNANPSVVAINEAGKTSNRAEIRALFVGDNNQPVKNIRARFDLDGDTNSIGGVFTSGDTVIFSDANGIALTSYIAGNRFSPTDGVSVRVCWDYSDFDLGTCPNQSRTSLTVISEPLSVTIGTDNKIVIEDLVYTQRFVVQVNDSSGLAKADAQVSPLLDLDTFSQGFWEYSVLDGRWKQVVTASRCENEDVNRNGVLEVYSNGGQEDANTNRQLDPRKADVVVAYEGSNRTDNTGRVVFRIVYPQNVGSWLSYKLTVAATGVSGTEGRATFGGELGVPITVVKNEATPPFVLSPYGQTLNPARVVVTTPDGRSQATLCTQ